MQKTCFKCGRELPLEEFYWLCRLCHRKVDSMEKLGVEVTSDTP